MNEIEVIRDITQKLAQGGHPVHADRFDGDEFLRPAQNDA